MVKLSHTKNIFESIKILKIFDKEHAIAYEKEAILKKRNPKGFFLEFEANRSNYNLELGTIKNISFEIKGHDICVEDLHLIYSSPPLDERSYSFL